MSTTPIIEVTLQVTTTDESTAADVAETMSRLAVGMSTTTVHASVIVDRYEQSCSHDHDEVGR